MDSATENVQGDRRRRRRNKRIDEMSIDSVSTVSKAVDDPPADNEIKEVDKVSVEEPDVVRKKKKKLKKIKTSSNDTPDETPVKEKRKKKKETLSSSEEHLTVDTGRKSRKKKERKKITGSQALLKEDFYSDPHLATTLEGMKGREAFYQGISIRKREHSSSL